jgi:hypothetical protein
VCYVKTKATYSKARAFCLKFGMQLYQASSSSAASAAISKLSKTALGGSRKASVYVDGMINNKCLTYNGLGQSKYDWCSTSYNFFCEFIDQGWK